MTDGADIIRQHVLPYVERIRPQGGGRFKASCPVPGHGKGNGDRNPSLSIGPGDTQPVVLKCQANCHQDDLKEALISNGVDWALCSTPGRARPTGPDLWMPCKHNRAAEYEYRSQDGTVQYGTARCARKGQGCPGFAYWRPDPTSRSGRRWSLNTIGPDGNKRRAVPHLPYRLPELLTAVAQGLNVWVVEGEKDADRLVGLGYPATCNDGGGGKWNDEYARWLHDADVMIVADRDETGWRHAETVVNSLIPIARSIEVLRADRGKDASDHLDAGLGIHDLISVASPLPAPVTVPGAPKRTPLEVSG